MMVALEVTVTLSPSLFVASTPTILPSFSMSFSPQVLSRSVWPASWYFFMKRLIQPAPRPS